MSVCSGHQEVAPPSSLPPAGSGPVVYTVVLCFPKQGNVSLVDPQTYLYYMQSPDLVSMPSQNVWKPYNEAAEQTIVSDHRRLWGTNFLDDLKIEAVDFPFSNGVLGKVIVYDMEERQRIKNTIYNEGTKAIEQTAIEERLRELGITIRLDSFVDQATEKRVANVIREMMVEKGFQEAKVEPVYEALPGGPKTVALKFKVTEGPKVKISNVDFVGNKVFSDGKLRGRMKTNKGGGFWIFPGSSIYQEEKFEEDADMVMAFYKERGYLQANVGQPNLKPIRDSEDGKTRYMTLEIPVTEGVRYRIDKFEFAGNDKVPGDMMRPLFKLRTGDLLQREAHPRGIREDQGDLRRRRSLRNDAVSGIPAGRQQRQHHDPDQRGQAVFRQPHHVPGQHDDSRQRHPTRAPAVRKRRVQHRGAEIQHQAAESARLLQAPRRSEKHPDRQDAWSRQQSRPRA